MSPAATSRTAATLRALGPLAGLAAVWLLFAAAAPSTFLTLGNQKLIVLQTATVGTAAIGATMIIVSGGIDLSVGSTIALGTVVIALLLQSGAPPAIAALGGIAAGAGIGLLVGGLVIGRIGRTAGVALGVLLGWLLVGALGAPLAILAGAAAAVAGWIWLDRWIPHVALAPFIVTLGMWGSLRGIAKGLGGNRPVYPGDAGWLPDLMSNAGPLAPGVWCMAALAVGATLLLARTRFGRHIHAIGSNELTARLCGVRVERVKLWTYAVGIGLAGVASTLEFAYLRIGDPTTAAGYELRVIAAAVIGGASLAGGEGTVRGTLVGALIMTTVDNGCTKLGLDNWVQEAVTGAIIIGAVALDRLRQRGR